MQASGRKQNQRNSSCGVECPQQPGSPVSAGKGQGWREGQRTRGIGGKGDKGGGRGDGMLVAKGYTGWPVLVAMTKTPQQACQGGGGRQTGVLREVKRILFIVYLCTLPVL